jgi:predicted TIM-barrel fold metal-dependent hydrolase
MVIDCHVHVSACTPGHGCLSPTMRKGATFRFMRWKFSLPEYGTECERFIEDLLARSLGQTEQVDAGVVLAFDGVYDRDGRLDEAGTHLYVTNDYVIELCRRHPRMLFGCSVNPYRKDAIAEIERCVAAGAVLLKWLPIVQDFNPADPRCFPVYECLAHHKLPLLSHTGGEKSLPVRDLSVADPMLLLPALERGVTVIAAHCGTRSAFSEPDYLPQFMRLARQFEHCYGDTAALCLPTRSYAFPTVLADRVVREKLVHGSDWPIPALPPVTQLGVAPSLGLLREKNWMRRDVLIKQRLGFDEGYWHRAAKILRMPSVLIE